MIYKHTYAPSYNSQLNLNEIGQSRSTRFAFAEYDDKKKEIAQLHLSVKCRDYFAEVLHGSAVKKSYSMFGFRWEGDKYQIDPSKTGIMVFISDVSQFDNFRNNFQSLVDWEKFTGFGVLPELHEVDGQASSLFVKCDPKWFANTFTISLYTLLLRCLCYSHIKSLFPRELFNSLPSGQDKHLINNMLTFGKDKVETVFKDPKYLILDNTNNGLGWGTSPSTQTIHDYGGIQSFFMSLNKDNSYHTNTTLTNKNVQAFLKAVA